MTSYNVKRIERDIEKNIPIIIQREARDELLKQITITGCKLTHDLSFCRVFFTSFSTLDKDKLEKEVNEASSFIRGRLSKVIEMRNTPELRFEYDTSLEYGERIENIIDNLNKE